MEISNEDSYDRDGENGARPENGETDNGKFLSVKPRKHYQGLVASNTRIIRKELGKISRLKPGSVDELVEMMTRYSELFDMVEDETLVRGGRYLGKNSVKNALGVAGYALRGTLAAYNARKRVYKTIATSPFLDDLPGEYSHVARVTSRPERFKSSLLSSVKEYAIVLFKYTNKLSSLKCELDGKKYSLPALSKFLKDPDRDTRERAYRAYYGVLLREKDQFNKVFDQLLDMRFKKARKAGYDNARDYYHDLKRRVDYTPVDCRRLHEAIEKEVVPVAREIREGRATALGLETLRPWDANIVPGQPNIEPYKSTSEFIEKLARMFHRVRPAYGELIRRMHAAGFIDPLNRRGKVSGAMCLPLNDHRAGYIIANAVGLPSDVKTLAHEGGHAVHWHAASGLPLSMFHELLTFPMEAAELGSMTMVFLTFDHLDEFFKEEAVLRAVQREILEGAILDLPMMAVIDAFQHWIYTNEGHDVEARMEKFGRLVDRFVGAAGIDYDGLEEERTTSWFRYSHVFQSPFYYIEYAIAQIGALSIFRNMREDRDLAYQQYHDFISLGNSRPLPELYEAAGTRLDFSDAHVRGVASFVREELHSLP